ncbi:cellular nucleic acid-binding protein-like [Aphis craccivora]|uniref:Cellular nucleic acid-binding protein-like n=1 Tax=Aphis craccivora TaxID=307492 RepID=A0A6G0YA10_APHCR|nr:cellular nucleic acid-binding protein-like [Aphis craccivora]
MKPTTPTDSTKVASNAVEPSKAQRTVQQTVNSIEDSNKEKLYTYVQWKRMVTVCPQHNNSNSQINIDIQHVVVLSPPDGTHLVVVGGGSPVINLVGAKRFYPQTGSFLNWLRLGKSGLPDTISKRTPKETVNHLVAGKKRTMDQNTHGTSTPVPGPHGFGGGGGVHQAKKTGNRKSGHEDYEDTTKHEEMEDEYLRKWIARSLHKEMKTWCTELNEKAKLVAKASKELESYIDKVDDRIVDLSSSLLEMSIQPIPPAVVKNIPPIWRPTPNRWTQRWVELAAAIVPEGKKKKAKKKYQGTHNRRETAEDIEHPFEGRQRKQNPYKKTSNEAVVVHPTGRMKKLKTGDLILQIGKGPKQEEAAERLRVAVTKALGADALVNHTPKTEVMEVRNLDSETTEEEVKQAVINTTGTAPDCERYQNASLIRREQNGSASCKGTDRTALCMTCGQENHKAKDCHEQPRCVLCLENEYSANHYPGSSKCRVFQEERRKHLSQVHLMYAEGKQREG